MKHTLPTVAPWLIALLAWARPAGAQRDTPVTYDGVYGRVNCIVVAGDRVIVAGAFRQAGSVAVASIAVWSEQTRAWSPLDGVAGGGVHVGRGNGEVHDMVVDGDRLYVGGYFDRAGETEALNIATYDFSTRRWGSLGQGVGTAGARGPKGSVYALALRGGELYVGGGYETAGGLDTSNIARVDTARGTWSEVGRGIGFGDQRVNAIEVSGSGELFIGGKFVVEIRKPPHHVARLAGGQWQPLGGGVGPESGGRVEALLWHDGRLYVSGNFAQAADRPMDDFEWANARSGLVQANGIAVWGGSSWSALGSGVEDAPAGGPAISYRRSIEAIAIDARGRLWAGGQFRYAGKAQTRDIAFWDPVSGWASPDGGLGGTVNDVVADRDGIIAGGDFSRTMNELVTRSVARWTGDRWVSFKPVN